MKQLPLISLIVAILGLAAAVTFGTLYLTQNKCKGEATETEASAPGECTIAYFQIDRVIEGYDMANDLRAVVETKVNNIQADITRRGNKLQKDYNDLQEKVNKGLITNSTAQVQAQKLAQAEQTFNNYAAQKQQEMQEEQMVMMNQIGDAIKTFTEAYNAEKGYSVILANQANMPVITGNAALDITDQIIAGLNEEYVKNKNSKKEE